MAIIENKYKQIRITKEEKYQTLNRQRHINY